MKENLTIVKVGGKIVEDPASLDNLIAEFSKMTGRKILVHGGGRSATRIASRLGIETKMVDGRRVTDSDTLDVVTMVYGGLVNKQIVAKLQAAGENAVGLTGADMNVVTGRRRPVAAVDYGWVGDVTRVDTESLSLLIDSGHCPVIAPLTHDGQGHMLNTNADTMAGEIAKALSSRYDVTLTYCFEKAGVLADENDDNSVIASLTPPIYASLRAQGRISGGMIPKLDNAFSCVEKGVSSVIITKADNISNPEDGTKIRL